MTCIVYSTPTSTTRAALRDLLGEIVLQPTPAGLVAEPHGKLEDLLPLAGEQALVVVCRLWRAIF